MAAAPGSRSMRNVIKQKRKAKRAAAPKKAHTTLGNTLGARRRAKKLAGRKYGAMKPAAAAPAA